MEFNLAFPRMTVDGKVVGSYNNPELGFPCIMSNSGIRLSSFIAGLRKNIRDDRRLVFIDGKFVMAYLNWIRDHVHMSKAFCHWECDLRTFLDFIIETQHESGFYFELIKQLEDPHYTFVNPEQTRVYEEDNVALTRLELEADVEYLVVEGANRVYSVLGDKEWLRKVLPSLEKSIDYMTSDEKRFDKEHGLVKRGITIDTWDFFYNTPNIDRRIRPETPMSIMHGDNSGVYAAMNMLARLNRELGNEEKAQEWETRAGQLRENMMKYLWNGDYFVHHLPLTENRADDLEHVRLSLSNTYDINRGVLSVEDSRKVIEEFMRRRETTECFCEWFSVDPPYHNGFGEYAAGTYVNGSICSFTAGELAKAAFKNGYEAYGWDIVQRMMELYERDNTIYFLYDRITSEATGIGSGPSGWSSAAIMSAIEEGLVGIINTGVAFDTMAFEPAFVVTDHTELRYVTGYEVNSTMVDLHYRLCDEGMLYTLDCPSKHIDCRVLLPEGKTVAEVKVNGEAMAFTTDSIGESNYAVFSFDTNNFTGKNKKHRIELYF